MSLTKKKLAQITCYMNYTHQGQLNHHLQQTQGPEHLVQITTEMSKKIWKMRTHHTGPTNWMNEFDNHTNICWKCQCRKTAICEDILCQTPRCGSCDETCNVCSLPPQHHKSAKKRKDANDTPALTSTHTMGTALYDKTEKTRFTTSTQSNEKNTVRKTLLLALFAPDETGTFFQRKTDTPQGQSPPTSDCDRSSSLNNDTPGTHTKSQRNTHPDPLETQSRTDTEGDHLEFRMKVRV